MIINDESRKLPYYCWSHLINCCWHAYQWLVELSHRLLKVKKSNIMENFDWLVSLHAGSANFSLVSVWCTESVSFWVLISQRITIFVGANSNVSSLDLAKWFSSLANVRGPYRFKNSTQLFFVFIDVLYLSHGKI